MDRPGHRRADADRRSRARPARQPLQRRQVRPPRPPARRHDGQRRGRVHRHALPPRPGSLGPRDVHRPPAGGGGSSRDRQPELPATPMESAVVAFTMRALGQSSVCCDTETSRRFGPRPGNRAAGNRCVREARHDLRPPHLHREAGHHREAARAVRQARQGAPGAPSRQAGVLRRDRDRRDQHLRPHLGVRERRGSRAAARRHAGRPRVAGVPQDERGGRQSAAPGKPDHDARAVLPAAALISGIA